MLTMKGKYGLKALCHLAGLAPGDVARSQEIALAIGMSKKFLDTILNDLRLAGFVVARKGRNGGYRLAAPPEEITAEQAVRALDGPLAPIRCVSLNFYQPCEDCPDEEACVVRFAMLEMRKAIVEALSGISIAQMRDKGEARKTPPAPPPPPEAPPAPEPAAPPKGRRRSARPLV